MSKWFLKFINRLAKVNNDTFKSTKLSYSNLNKQYHNKVRFS